MTLPRDWQEMGAAHPEAEAMHYVPANPQPDRWLYAAIGIALAGVVCIIVVFALWR